MHPATVFLTLLVGVSAYKQLPPNILHHGWENSDVKFAVSANSIGEVGQPLNTIADLIANAILNAIGDLPDPLNFEDVNLSGEIDDSIEYSLQITGMSVTGLSGITIDSVSLSSILPPRVSFALTLPQLVFNIQSLNGQFVIYGVVVPFNIAGQITVTSTQLTGTMGVTLIPVGVNSVTAQLTVGVITSTLTGSIAGQDITGLLTEITTVIIPGVLNNLSSQINTAVSAIILVFAQNALS